jgi:hypothetical protein
MVLDRIQGWRRNARPAHLFFFIPTACEEIDINFPSEEHPMKKKAEKDKDQNQELNPEGEEMGRKRQGRDAKEPGGQVGKDKSPDRQPDVQGDSSQSERGVPPKNPGAAQKDTKRR